MRYLSLESFIKGPTPNLYIKYKDLNVYVRKGIIYIDKDRLHVLQIANISNVKRSYNIYIDPNMSRTGLLKEFDDVCMKLAKTYEFEGLYYENVLNDFLPGWLERNNYRQVNHQYGIPCFYKPTNN